MMTLTPGSGSWVSLSITLPAILPVVPGKADIAGKKKDKTIMPKMNRKRHFRINFLQDF
jgi:hypothetical protein